METTLNKDNIFSLSATVDSMKGKSSLHRLFRKEIIDNRKLLMMELATVWGACILFGCLLGFYGRGGGFSELAAFYFIIELIACIFGSMIFSDMKNKKGRISTLMLPASAADKFFIRWLFTVPLMAVVGIIGYYLGDLSRLFIAWLSNQRVGSEAYHQVLNPFTLFFDYDTLYLALLGTATYFFMQSVYILGGIVWPKLSFLKTFALFYCLEIIFGIASLFFIRIWSEDHLFRISPKNETTILTFILIFLVILTLCFYWLTYRRFKNSEVIYRLF
ncbi:MAG: hypothetical protein K2K64_06095 [Muribaculaceae bacterium]|nr:hypothetical protein [Muribaculaceae bacterium]